MAEYGVNPSPAVIPSWIDMQPEGEFLQSLYRDKLPPTVSFFMFTGLRGNRNPFGSNNDGTITLASLMAASAKPDRHHVPVSIENNGTHELKFSLTPDGMIYGYVAAAQNAENRPAGMPAEQYLPGDREVNIQTVTLSKVLEEASASGIIRSVNYVKVSAWIH
jgi:hypothetical protein